MILLLPVIALSSTQQKNITAIMITVANPYLVFLANFCDRFIKSDIITIKIMLSV